MQLLTATVHHTRHAPLHNSFTYGVYYLDVPVTRERVETPSALFSWARVNLFSLYTRDHGARSDGTSWYTWVRDVAAQHGIELTGADTMRLIAHPRVLGFAFNPISFWLITRGDALRAVICEVHNTFGDSHTYVLAHADRRPIEPHDVLTAQKHLFVSPFNTMQGEYTFSFTTTHSIFKSHITYSVDGTKTLTAVLTGTRHPLTTRSLLWAFVRYPFMTLMVVARIHLQAAKLWLRGLPHALRSYPGATHGKSTKNTT